MERIEGRVSGFLLCVVALDISTCPGLSPWGSTRDRGVGTEPHHPQTHIHLLGKRGKEQPGKGKGMMLSLMLEL